MTTYQVTVRDDFFDKEFLAEIDAVDEDSAVAIAKEHYAYELDTTEDYIEVVSVNPIRLTKEA